MKDPTGILVSNRPGSTTKQTTWFPQQKILRGQGGGGAGDEGNLFKRHSKNIH